MKPTKRERLIKQYEQIIEEEVFSNDEKGISMPVLYGVVCALKEGLGPEHFALERDVNMQHMDVAYFRKIRWTWDRAIRATSEHSAGCVPGTEGDRGMQPEPANSPPWN